MARAAAVCKATIFLLAVAIFASVVSSASDPLMAAKATDHDISKEKSSLLPVHDDRDKEEMAEEAKAGGEQGSGVKKTTNSVSTEDEEEGKKTGSHWGKARKLDDDDGDDSDDSDHDSDSDHDHDHDHDHDSDSDHDHDSETDSDDNSDDDDHSSKNERKNKHAAQGRKGALGRG